MPLDLKTLSTEQILSLDPLKPGDDGMVSMTITGRSQKRCPVSVSSWKGRAKEAKSRSLKRLSSSS